MDFSNEIKNSVTMDDIARMYGLKVNRAGFTNCPFHSGDHTASLKLYPGKRGFYCFGCGESGSVIDFVMKYFSLSYMEAAEKINNDFSLGLPIGEKISLRKRREIEHKQAERKAINDAEEEEKRRVERFYWESLEEYTNLEKFIEAERPEPGEEPTKQFLNALKRKQIAEIRLSEAETELYRYENQR